MGQVREGGGRGGRRGQGAGERKGGGGGGQEGERCRAQGEGWWRREGRRVGFK